ncbi:MULTISPECIES: squalene synthase HpnC [unclassified Minwuia]|uniref:squalene synthase HpnC n=1 Tax=unclassified Minwuia TaxID=2618799 RepID=UPI0024784D93|nr:MULTISPECIES: squalene synthase HpnC [unclassified Minwuia]
MTAELQMSRQVDPAAQAREENFPVGSVLLPRGLRPHVATFYAFARTADDIADAPDLTAPAKLERLDALEAALINGSDLPACAVADRLRRSLLATGVTDTHARDLLAAFRRDARQDRCRDIEQLRDYCRLSASPVGRYLLDLHGEDRRGHALSDPLCDALQIINHLQDCKEDFQRMNRVYLPLDWLQDSGTDESSLLAGRSSPALRAVLDRCLDLCDTLLEKSRPLPHSLKSARLGAEAAVIHALARRMARRLRNRDPLCQRTRLSKPSALLVSVLAAGRFALTRAFGSRA